jgi:hypothetical protein
VGAPCSCAKALPAALVAPELCSPLDTFGISAAARTGSGASAPGEKGSTFSALRLLRQTSLTQPLPGEWRGGISPPRSLRTVRETLASYGSHQANDLPEP